MVISHGFVGASIYAGTANLFTRNLLILWIAAVVGAIRGWWPDIGKRFFGQEHYDEMHRSGSPLSERWYNKYDPAVYIHIRIADPMIHNEQPLCLSTDLKQEVWGRFLGGLLTRWDKWYCGLELSWMLQAAGIWKLFEMIGGIWL